jgi:hypothetical protein
VLYAIMEIVTMARIVDDSSTAICNLPCQPGHNQLPLLCLWNWAVALVWRIFRLTRDPCIFWVHTSCRHDMQLLFICGAVCGAMAVAMAVVATTVEVSISACHVRKRGRWERPRSGLLQQPWLLCAALLPVICVSHL